MSIKIIKKKCPYCGADTEYNYGDHEMKCPMCKQSCIIDYERPSFSDLIKMKEHCEKQLKIAMECCGRDFYDYYGMSEGELMREREEEQKRVDACYKRIQAIDAMLEEAVDVEIMLESKEK